MLTRREQDRHEQLILQCLDDYDGSPEQFGALLFDATQTLDPFVFGMDSSSCSNFRKYAQQKASARRRIAGMKDGAELLRLEEKCLR